MIEGYQYCLSAVVTTLLIIIIVFQRRSYNSQRNNLFIILLFINLFAALADFLAGYMAEYFRFLPIWVPNLLYYIYLTLHSATTPLFALYAASLLNSKKLARFVAITGTTEIVLLAVLYALNVYNHLLFSFDENFVVTHGYYMVFLLPIPFSNLVFATYMFFKRWRQYNGFQLATAAMMLVLDIICMNLQVAYPSFDADTLVCALIFIAVYIGFESPEGWTFLDTKCFNYRALGLELHRKMRLQKPTNCLLVGILNSPNSKSFADAYEYRKFACYIAAALYKEFGHNVFAADSAKFIVFLTPGAENEKPAKEKIKKCFEAPVVFYGPEIYINYRTRSVPLESLVTSEQQIQDLIETLRFSSVDRLFSAESISGLALSGARKHKVSEALKRAVEDSSFRAVYQPIIDTMTETFHSVEVLCRLKDPILGELHPSEFIPVAEENGTILPLGEAMLRCACDFVKNHGAESLGIDLLEVNVSVSQLEKPGLAADFRRIAGEYGIRPGMINLEVTESEEILSDPVVMNNISTLTAAGFGISLDDYGTGFASADYLFRLPSSIVKIDKMITSNAITNPRARVVLECIVSMAKKLEKRVVAEGVEDKAGYDLVVGAGAEFVQGFYFSKPLERDAFISFLKEHGNK